MAQLTLQEAADKVGVNKSTIWRALKNGRISATQDNDGQYQIDEAELARVYPPGARNDAERNHVQLSATGKDAFSNSTLQLELAVLQERLKAMEKENAGLVADKAAAEVERDRLLGIIEQSQRLLSHQKPAAQIGIWRRIFGR